MICQAVNNFLQAIARHGINGLDKYNHRITYLSFPRMAIGCNDWKDREIEIEDTVSQLENAGPSFAKGFGCKV
jgi:hypothetical protein